MAGFEIPHRVPEVPLAERRIRIIIGAAQIFIESGYVGASMSRIASAADVSKGTLYNYFSDKKMLFETFVWWRCDRLEEIVREQFEFQSDSVAAELIHVGMKMLRIMLSDDALPIYRVIAVEALRFPELAKAFSNAGPNAFIRRMEVWLRAQVVAGKLQISDPLFAAEQFFALIHARAIERALTDADYRATDAEIHFVVDCAVDVFLAAYGCNV